MQTVYYVYSFETAGRYLAEDGSWVQADDPNIKAFTNWSEAETVAYSHGAWVEEETVYPV